MAPIPARPQPHPVVGPPAEHRRPRRVPRTPSPTERGASVVLLLALVVIAAAVERAGRRPNPDLLPPDVSALATDHRSTPRPTAALDDAVSRAATAFAEPGWRVESGPEAFSPERLYEKIDGRADLYLRHGVRRLVAFSVASGDRFIDVFVYDLGRPDAALQMLAAEQPPGARAVEVGRQGYTASGSDFFTAGCYYTQVVTADTTAESTGVALRLAEHLASRLEPTPCE